jgi:hypothetical protein
MRPSAFQAFRRRVTERIDAPTVRSNDPLKNNLEMDLQTSRVAFSLPLGSSVPDVGPALINCPEAKFRSTNF